jgi:hypothetical protein
MLTYNAESTAFSEYPKKHAPHRAGHVKTLNKSQLSG